MGMREFNYLSSVMRHPCANGSIAIAATTGLRALTPVLFDFVSFGCREPLKWSAGRGQVPGWFRDAGYPPMRAPHRRPRTSGGRIIPPQVNSFQSAFWALDARLERALLYWFIFELSQDFLVNWTSLMYQENGCDGPAAGHCTVKIQDQLLLVGGPTDMLLGATSCASLPITIGAREIIVPAGVSATITYSFNAEPWPAFPDPSATSTARLRRWSDGSVYGASEWGNGVTGVTGLTGTGNRLGGGLGVSENYSVQGEAFNGPVWCTNGICNITLTGHKVPLIPLQDCFKEKKNP